MSLFKLIHGSNNVYDLDFKKDFLVDVQSMNQQLKQVVDEALSLKARMILFRPEKLDITDELRSALVDCGFSKKLDRAEFRKTVADLPTDEGTPLVWKSAEELRWNEVMLAELLEMSSFGDPNLNPEERAIDFIKECLSDPVLTKGTDCFHIGFLKEEIAAFAVVQINPKTGWSRISYMAILPKFRKQGLGKWVHRYCFRLMKNMGGKIYQGGTSVENKSMMNLFKKHECELFSEMEEWAYNIMRPVPARDTMQKHRSE